MVAEKVVVEELVLEKSRVAVSVRGDGSYSVARASRERIWHDRLEKGAVIGIGEHTPGDVEGESWWVVCGQSDVGADVTVRLEDGSHVPVRRIGDIFVSEWVSLPQQALLYRSDWPVESQPANLSVLFACPRFMPKAPFPENDRL
ncbi:hypothetical protein [Rhodococcus sp. IEGM 1379]|uniref:hypothetical protein n=1 Tax=Rhodococcus sp. IEGM 1379 TaxID=3047086 RepID=UPI0024B6D34B|nr:hypothetical protein [Rhodococcus sp. IEGM 1379]MDI9915162.1 hypothetical protein [Rhodococcus sp. IEGM 1379]